MDSAVVNIPTIKPLSTSPDEKQRRLSQCEQRICERRDIGRHLGFEIFSNPAWDMMLDLYRAFLLGQQISISSLTLASNVPATTARRSIAAIVEAKLAYYRPDPTDRRRVHIEITPRAVEKLELIFDLVPRSSSTGIMPDRC